MNSERRKFLKLAGGAVVTAGTVAAPLIKAQAQYSSVPTLGILSAHELPQLDYFYDSLEPHIDAHTMELHHSKHHKGYVRGLSKAEEMLAKARATGDYSMVQYWSKKAAFHGAGHFLHSLFWKIMAPAGDGGGGEPTGVLGRKIHEDFGTFAKFKEQFSAAAKSVEGSGWAVLSYRKVDGRLNIMQTENHQKLNQWIDTPILCVDVWEHAYYLKYQNNRAEYIKNWWNVVNWAQVDQYLIELQG